MRVIRGLVIGLIVAGAIAGSAGATPRVARPIAPTSFHKVPLPAPVHALRPSTAKPSESTDQQKSKDRKDSSTGLTGLDNAIAHVSQNLADHPNKGLANALAHLQANKAKHEAKARSHGAAKVKSKA